MNNILWTPKMAMIVSLFILSLFIVYCIYSGIVYVFFRSHYKGIHFTTRNITYITMLSAASVTITVVISRIIPLTVLPPIRISFEGLMIKISGFIFGPIVGFISGAVTDALCLLFIPSYFHIAYFLLIVFYGFSAGLVSSFNRLIKNHKWIIFLFSNIFVVSFITLISYFTLQMDTTKINIYGNIYISKNIAIFILILSGMFAMLFQFAIFIYYILTRYKDRYLFLNATFAFTKLKEMGEKKEVYGNILAIVFLTIFTEYFLTGIISPWGDVSIFSGGSPKDNSGYGALVLFRIMEAPIKIVFNTAIIYISWRAIYPLIHKDK